MFYFKRLTRIFMRLVYYRSKYSMFKDTSTQFTCLADNSVLLSVMLSLGMTDLWTTGFTKKKIDVTGKIAQNVVYFPRLKLVKRVIYCLFIREGSILSVYNILNAGVNILPFCVHKCAGKVSCER